MSLPASRTKFLAGTAGSRTVAGTPGAGKESGTACSIGTTASAPGGIMAPVMIGAAVPGASSGGAAPAGTGATTRSPVPPSGTSALRMA